MQELGKKVYEQPEDFRRGFIHGFYDAKSDDGAFYGKETGNGKPGIRGATTIERTRLYREGYSAGQIARLQGCLSFLSESADEALALNPS